MMKIVHEIKWEVSHSAYMQYAFHGELKRVWRNEQERRRDEKLNVKKSCRVRRRSESKVSTAAECRVSGNKNRERDRIFIVPHLSILLITIISKTSA